MPTASAVCRRFASESGVDGDGERETEAEHHGGQCEGRSQVSESERR